MLDRQRGKIIFECDVCGDTLDTETGDFNEARALLEREEWKARKMGSDWLHSCSKCGVPSERAPLAKASRLL
ncbi:hypothetical protein [Bradyrhizobium sp.]|uniref:hypothetical protein n=1 Tax=Bradyrhizobium sp. TaxID=376 RepID=UPI003C5F37CC